MEAQLIKFLTEELLVPDAAIALAKRQPEVSASLLPMQLWQYGLISLDELNRIFDWLEAA